MANLPPPTTDGKAARGGSMLDQLQVTLTPAGEHWELQGADYRLVSPSASIIKSFKLKLEILL